MRFNLNLDNDSYKNLEKVVTDFEVISTQFNKQRVQASKKFKLAFEDFMKDFFTLVPCVKRVVWNQYTPYFNDGDSCTFSVNEPTFYNYLDSDDEDNEDDVELPEGQWALDNWDLRNYAQHGITEEEHKVMLFLNQVISGNEDFFEEIFGDHMEITVTAKGMNAEEYSHE